MKGDIQKSLAIYKEQLSNGYIQTAYIALTKYVAELKGKFPKNYFTSNIGFGYLDYTYFYFTNDYVKNKKLKFAMVLNHEKCVLNYGYAPEQQTFGNNIGIC